MLLMIRSTTFLRIVCEFDPISKVIVGCVIKADETRQGDLHVRMDGAISA